MGSLKISGCMSIVSDMSDLDRDALLDRLELYVSDSIPIQRAQAMAAADALAELEAERSDFMRMLREQHPEIFRIEAPEPTDDELTITDAGAADVGIKFSPRRKPDPAKSVTAYKLFRVDPKRPGELFPLFVKMVKGADAGREPSIPVGSWQDAEFGAPAPSSKSGKAQVSSSLGPLAFRPGWHAGDVPIATHIGDKTPEQKAEIKRIKDLRKAAEAKLGTDKKAKAQIKKMHPFPDWVNAPAQRSANHVWAEIEMPDDIDWQAEASKRGYNDKGQFVAGNAHITDQMPEDGHYRYKTNSNMTGNWLIAGSMKINRILSDDEVKAINDAAGVADLPRARPFDAKKYGFKASVERALQTDTPEFRRWFGDSKVVDENGEPLVVYHGTAATDIKVFKGYRGLAAHFAFDPKFASDFADARYVDAQDSGTDEEYGDGAVVYPAYLKAERIFDARDQAHLTLLDAKLRESGRKLTGKELWDYDALESYREQIEEAGFDSYYDFESGVDEGVTGIAVFSPKQIKSATGNNGNFDPKNPDIRRSVERTPLGFYSALARGVETMQTKQAPAGAWKAQIKGLVNKGLVKQDEIEWSGVNDWLDLQEGKVAKEQVLEYLKQGGVKVEEAVLESRPEYFIRDVVTREVIEDGFTTREAAEQWARDNDIDGDDYDIILNDETQGDAKYDAYTLPGGENYREVLLTLPHRGDYETPNGARFTQEELADPVVRATVDKIGKAPVGAYRSSHWDQPNVLAHIRVNDRTDADGKRVLFVEELQSDWGQEGKKKGFARPLRELPDDVSIRPAGALSSGNSVIRAAAKREYDRVIDAAGMNSEDDVVARFGDKAQRLIELDQEVVLALHSRNTLPEEADFKEWLGMVRQIVPDAFSNLSPFRSEQKGWGAFRGGQRIAWALTEEEAKSNALAMLQHENEKLPPAAPFVTKTEGWLNLALKRVMVMAAEGGYDKVAFVNGEQSAERYDLSKRVDQIRYKKNEDGTFDVWASDRSGAALNDTVDKQGLKPAQIEDFVGKEVAQKIVDGQGREEDGDMVLEGVDLKVGGEGMKTFYDQIVPLAAKKLLPKVGGGQMGVVSVNVDTDTAGFDKSNSWIMDERGSGLMSYRTRAEAEQMLPSIQAMYPQKQLRVVTGNPDSSALPQPGFDVTPAMREKVAEGLPLFSAQRPWFDDLSELKVSTNYKLGDLLKTSKKLSWWDRTVGTQYNLAQKHPQFKRVFDAVQRFINDVSAYASKAADLAPNILPKLETLKDIARSPLSAEDVKALRDPIFGGTLNYTRDDDGNIVETEDVSTAGVVFTNDELRTMFGLNDRQVGLYREFRRAVNRSLSDLAVSDMLRYLGTDGEGVRQRALEATNLDGATDAVVAHLDQLIAQQPARAEVLEESKRVVKEKAGQAIGLMARGYAPLSRFGRFTVDAVGADGERLYFSMFENERDANKMVRELREQYPDATIEAGTMSQESYKLFSGVTPETLALFGETLGLEESGVDAKSQVFQEYLKAAKSNRSAMKRLIQRKGIDGFSEDAGRVLAGFVYSNARQISTNLHAGEIGRSASAVTDGDVKDAAIRLMEYVQNPREEAQAIRGLMFTQFIGGSVASALVNMTQPFTMTMPYLSQFDGVTGAAKRMSDAVSLTTRGIRNDEQLKEAIKRAENEGVVSPQEVHQLMAQAQGSGSLQAGDGTAAGNAAAKLNNAMAKLGLAWGKLFSAAEQFNRRVTFIAAYKLARDQGMADPYAFAEQAIAETQGIYNKGNKPTWARGAVGSTLFTFKQYSISYVEFLRRMWGNGPEGKKAVGLALGVLFLSAGMNGLPGADDLDDVIDGIAQRVLGKSFDSKQARKEFLASILGQPGAEFVMSGISGLPGMPIDVAGRMGLGNLIPGTGLLTKKTNYGRDYLEVIGPAGTLFTNAGTALANVAQGDAQKAAEVMAPVAAQNWIKSMDMATMGYYRDFKGRKVVDTDAWDAAAKFIGFQPRAVAEVQDATIVQQNLIGQNKIRETEIADKWARGRIESKPELVQEAREELAEWNRKNPDSPIRIDAGQINKRVQEANKTKAQRVAATAPKEIRDSVKRSLEQVD